MRVFFMRHIYRWVELACQVAIAFSVGYLAYKLSRFFP